MSLVNQVLRDLDARRQERPAADALEGLRVAAPVNRVSYKAGIGIGVIIILVVAGVLAWQVLVPSAPGRQADAAASRTAPAEMSAVTPPAVPAAADTGSSAPEADAAQVAHRQTEPDPPRLPPHALAPAAAAPPPVAVEDGPGPDPEPEAAADPPDTPAPAAQRTTPAPEVTKTRRPLSAAQRAEQAYAEAVTAMQQGRMRQAEGHLHDALTADAGHVRAREMLAGLLLRQQRAREALEVLAAGLDRQPGHPAFARLYARLILDQGREDEAIQTLEQALVNATDDAGYLGLLAAAYQRAQQYRQAVEGYRGALSINPREARWWMGLGLSYEQLGEVVPAVKAYGSALQNPGLNPETREFVRGRIRQLRANG